jgi:hypothetical protein
LADKE